MADEDKKEGNRAVGVLGGGGMGAFILQFAPMFDDPVTKDIFVAAVPFISVFLSEFFTFVTAVFSLDAQSVRLRFRLKMLKWKLYWGKKNKSVSQEIRDLAQKRYDVIVAFEMGVYSLEYLNHMLAHPPAANTQPEPTVANPPPPPTT
ncbi:MULTISPECIES: hypothetical protein [Pectobacterium]|uniref:hypothetical protein n=1 Tax=Pectobacterium TaxID=122277 RepID=UPI001CF3C5D2|nr:hypothetical protein [Pectobacterium odoriferum]MCA6962280.1 hypothetical protein [Pectobacterium odoriferum]MCH5010379.1 hypothetical protein [Pectobacterium odoriferum]